MNQEVGEWPTGMMSWLDERGPLFAFVFLMVFVLALYHGALSRWWWYDDLQHLKEAALYSPAQYLLVPDIWQRLIAIFFTPLITLSFDLDYTLFGLNPAPFYAHQLVSLALAAFAFYLLLNLWVSRSFALFGAVLLLLSTPFALASSLLSIRHYIEGMALASFSLYAWVVGLRRQSNSWHWGSAALYLLAMMAKEIYIPLVGLMVLVPEGRWRERLRASLPFWALMVVFLLWRYWMLGGQFGGYGMLATSWKEAPGMVTSLALLLPVNYFLRLFGVNWLLPVWLGLFTAAIFGWIRLAPARMLSLALAVLVLVSVPLIPIIPDFPPQGVAVTNRYFTVPAAALITALILGLARWDSSRKARAMIMVVLAGISVAFGVQSHSMLSSWKDPAAREKEGVFLLEKSSGSYALAVPSVHTNSFYRAIRWLRSYSGHGETPPTEYSGYFRLELKTNMASIRRIYRYEEECDCLKDVTETALNEREKIVGRLVERPLQIQVNWGHGWLGWSLGPYQNGKYFFLAGQQSGWYSTRHDVASQGMMAYLLEGYMRVGYESPEGLVALSPEFHANLAEPGHFDWSGIVDGK